MRTCEASPSSGEGTAAADADRKRFSFDNDGAQRAWSDALGHAAALLLVHIGADDERELIAADAEGVSPGCGCGAAARADLLEQPVARA